MAYQDRIDPTRLVFIDETWTKTNMAPLRGWSPQGQRLATKVPHAAQLCLMPEGHRRTVRCRLQRYYPIGLKRTCRHGRFQ